VSSFDDENYAPIRNGLSVVGASTFNQIESEVEVSANPEGANIFSHDLFCSEDKLIGSPDYFDIQ